MTHRNTPPRRAVGFSLVEVVLALGIFSFAMVAMLAVFGGTQKNTRSLMDLEAMMAVRQAVVTALDDLPAATVYATPAGQADSAARPEIFVWGQTNGTGFSLTNTTSVTDASSASNTPDGRIYRARLYRALTGAGGAEAVWTNAKAAYFPLRVQLDAFVAGAYSATASPLESSSFNAVWNAR